MAGLAFISFLGGASCGGDDAGLDSSKPIGQLTSAEQARFCDTTNGAQGGYGRSTTCPDGSTATTDPDRATCVAAIPVVAQKCPALVVGDAVGCASAVASHLCNFATEARCQALRDCMNR